VERRCDMNEYDEQIREYLILVLIGSKCRFHEHEKSSTVHQSVLQYILVNQSRPSSPKPVSHMYQKESILEPQKMAHDVACGHWLCSQFNSSASISSRLVFPLRSSFVLLRRRTTRGRIGTFGWLYKLPEILGTVGRGGAGRGSRCPKITAPSSAIKAGG
jgi:hypothetical protein